MVSIINPSGKPKAIFHPTAKRPKQLDGLVIGLLDNGKQNADHLVLEVGRLLGERVNIASTLYMPRQRPGMDFDGRAKNGAYDAVLQDLVEQCDVVVNGVGD